MLLSLPWLREFTPYEGTAQALGDRLTMLGLELEEIRRPYEAIAAIVTGQVIECTAHPESDHLHICKVDAGQSALLDIVCGAPNVAAGQKVPVALVGTRMPDGLVIKEAKLRGAPSFGMICSERELGLTEEHSGIMVLPQSAPVGARLIDCLDLDTELLEISITPNRADCLSVLGLARETALAFKLPLTLPKVALHEDATQPEVLVPIDIADPDLCMLYSGRVVSGIIMGPSPMRVRHRLHAMGVRPISNIVDVTNYILLECGQPLHSFDLDKLHGGRIVVRRAQEGESLITLDGRQRELATTDLCICDAARVVGLAGVMGGLDTEISAESRNVFFESAAFRPGAIRKTSRRLGLSSEASYRFERGIDQLRTPWALDRACAMAAEVSGGVVRRGFSKAEPRPFTPARMIFRPERADAVLGVHLTPQFDEAVLTGMGCTVDTGDTAGVNATHTAWSVTQPSWRPDLTREADLIEEVGRVHGLDSIAPELPPILQDLARAGAAETAYAFRSRIKHWGAGLGLNEAVNYSFVGHKDLDRLDLPTAGRISILNPLSAEQDVLRTALTPGLLQNLRTNLAQNASGLRLFEVATIFAADASSETTAHETSMLGLLLYGARHDASWPQAEADADYADLKGIVEHVLNFLHLPIPQYEARDTHSFLLPCVSVSLAGREIGVMGRIKPAVADEFHARKDVWVAELNMDILRELHAAACVSFTSLPVYPPVRRDITVMAGYAVKVGDVLAHIAGLALPLLVDTTLVDCFEPADSEERNLTFRLTFRHPERTLKDAEVDKEREKVAESLTRTLLVRV